MFILNICTIDKNIDIFLQKENAIISELKIDKENVQSELLVSLVEDLLKNNNLDYKDIDCFSVINGPGSFIGIKVSISFIKAIKSVYNNKKFIVNNVFEVLSFNEDCDYIILKADSNNCYIKSKNNDIDIISIDIINNKNNILNNKKVISNIYSDNFLYKVLNNDLISKINYYKYKNNLFNDNITALYIREPQINTKK